MGCVSSKSELYQLDTSFQKSTRLSLLPTKGIYFHDEQDAYVKARLLEVIKKGDAFLFQQTLNQYNVKPTEILTSTSERRGIIHFLAQYNFAQGMSLIIDRIFKNQIDEASYILNARDSAGNTGTIICCLNDSVQTLEVLLKSDQINVKMVNYEGKAALAIALERESPCAKVLSLYMTQNVKPPSTTVKPNSFGSIQALETTFVTSQWSPFKKDDYFESPLLSAEIAKPLTSNESFFAQTDQVKVPPSSKLFSIVESLRESNDTFIDEEFPHDNHSLTGDNYLSEYFKGSTVLKWASPRTFMPRVDSIKIFDKVQVNDVSMSPIAGCDLYSVLAMMTEFPQRLFKIFTVKERNRFGCYSVLFSICGVPIEVALDDYFPCLQSGQLAFSRPKNNELWFCFLEKAVAKVYGSYAEIDAVGMSEAFEMITGMPSAQLKLKALGEEQLWGLLKDYHNKNYFVSVGHHRSENLNISCHYTIINIIEVNKAKIVKLRTQYGNGDQYRLYIDKMKSWSEEFKKKIGYFENETDCFYMEAIDLLDQFDFLTVCYYHENWNRNRTDVKSEPKEEVFFEFTLDKSTEMFISVHQKLPFLVNEGPEYKISPVEITVVQEVENDLKCIAYGGRQPTLEATVHASHRIRMSLSEGKYMIRAKVNWIDKQSHTFSISTLSSSPVVLKRVENNKYPDFMEKAYLDLASKSKEQYIFKNDCVFVSGLTGSYMYVCGINKGEKIWNLQINFEAVEGLKIIKKYATEDKIIKLRIAPGGKQIALIKRTLMRGTSLQWNLVQSWEDNVCETIQTNT